jgi:hypothetical protein
MQHGTEAAGLPASQVALELAAALGVDVAFRRDAKAFGSRRPASCLGDSSVHNPVDNCLNYDPFGNLSFCDYGPFCSISFA